MFCSSEFKPLKRRIAVFHFKLEESLVKISVKVLLGFIFADRTKRQIPQR